MMTGETPYFGMSEEQVINLVADDQVENKLLNF